jgi:hypothetical protein
MLVLVFACSESEEMIQPHTESPVNTIEKALIVEIDFVSVDACGSGSHGLQNIEIDLSKLVADSGPVWVQSAKTDYNGRVYFEDIEEGTFRVRGEHDYGYEEVDVAYTGGKQTIVLRF